MTHRMLWVLKAHTKIHKMNDNCQNIRQDFDIYRNIDNQKAKKLKMKQKTNNTHTQTSDQTNKQTNKRTNEQCLDTPSYVLKKRDAKTLHATVVKRNP